MRMGGFLSGFGGSQAGLGELAAGAGAPTFDDQGGPVLPPHRDDPVARVLADERVTAVAAQAQSLDDPGARVRVQCTVKLPDSLPVNVIVPPLRLAVGGTGRCSPSPGSSCCGRRG